MPQAVVDFVTRHVSSVVELELLLVLQTSPGDRWDAASLAGQMRIEPAWTSGRLEALAEKGLVVADQDGGLRRYQYAPRDQALARQVAEVARAYLMRRVTVIALIFSKPNDQLKTFADAFRFKRET